MRHTTHNAMIEHPLTARRRALESAVADAGAGAGPPRRLYEAVLEFLTRGGESEVLAAWVMAVHRAAGAIQPPGEGSPVVSVIVPCHNYGAYLRECVESVLMQTFAAWELIVVNDGSTDDTPAVAAGLLADHPGHRIRYLEQECRGIVQPRNRGVTLAKGEFILPLDADDLLAPTFLERTVEVLTNRPDLGYVSTRALFFGSTNKIWPGEPLQPLALLVTNQQTNTTLYRRRMWRDVGGYDERMVHGYMDWEFWIRCTKKGGTGTQIEEPLFFYRRKADSVVMRAKKRDAAIKEQIIRLHPDVYDVARLGEARQELHKENWIPPVLLRPDLVIPRRGPGGAATDEAAKDLARPLLEMLVQLLPSLAHVFTRPDAGQGDPAIFNALSARLSRKAATLAERGGHDAAVETAASLLAAYPGEIAAVVLTMRTLARSSREPEAYALGRQYMALLPLRRDLHEGMADLLAGFARDTPDQVRAMALLDAATMLVPTRAAVWADFAAHAGGLGQYRAAKRALAAARGDFSARKESPRRLWYVTDTFGFGAGGVNGVTQAKFMTLSSVLRGADGPDVVVVTTWHAGLPDAMAEFAQHTALVCGEDGFRWPLWVALEQGREPGENPRWRMAGAPDLLIEEGVLLEGHRFLRTLPALPDCPRLFVHHTSPDQYTGKFEYRNLFDEAMRAFVNYEYHVCVSSNVISEWKRIDGLGKKNWIYIPNCAPEEEAARLLRCDQGALRESLGLPREAMVYLCLASVQTRKGHDILLEQMAEVFHKVPEAILVCVGPVHGEWSGWAIVEQARKRYGAHRVRFLGVRKNALEYVRACDCLVLPSREEALPLVILEAMALEKPCVASDVNGIPELVEHGVTGLLFSLGLPRDLARHMVALAKDPARAQAMGRQAKARYQALFARKRHAARWAEAIEAMAGQSVDA
ncbi:MAG: glycosyltransferase [Desulfovibrio sp.]|nr:glycosyltransferase [Desulfovibrio sp.]